MFPKWKNDPSVDKTSTVPTVWTNGNCNAVYYCPWMCCCNSNTAPFAESTSWTNEWTPYAAESIPATPANDPDARKSSLRSWTLADDTPIVTN